MRFSVVLDTNVLYGATLRDTLLRLAEAGLYRPRWSRHILDEVRRVVGTAVGDLAAVERVLAAMTGAFDDAMVEGYEHLVDAMESPDPDDRHVLAAAVRAGASGIVTANTADFPQAFARSHDLLIIHPDEFLLDLLDMAPVTVLRALEQQSADYTKPARTVPEILDALGRSGAPGFASEMASRLSSN